MQFLALFSWVSVHFKIAQVALFSFGLVLVWVSMFVFWKACYNCGVSIFAKKNVFIDLLRPVVVVAAQAVQNKTVQQKSRKTTAKKISKPSPFSQVMQYIRLHKNVNCKYFAFVVDFCFNPEKREKDSQTISGGENVVHTPIAYCRKLST